MALTIKDGLVEVETVQMEGRAEFMDVNQMPTTARQPRRRRPRLLLGCWKIRRPK